MRELGDWEPDAFTREGDVVVYFNYRIQVAADLAVEVSCKAAARYFHPVAYLGYQAPMIVMTRAGTWHIEEPAVPRLLLHLSKDQQRSNGPPNGVDPQARKAASF